MKNRQRLRGALRALLVVVVCPLIIASESAGQTTSVWAFPGAGGDWLVPDNWSAEIPQNPGDVATIFATPAGVEYSTGPGLVTLGQLHISGVGGASLVGDEPLTFDQPGADPARVTLGAISDRNIQANFVSATAIAADETLLVDVNSRGELRLDGPLVSPAGDLEKVGGGVLRLTAASPSWNGALLIGGGDVVVEEVNALAGSDQVRVAQGAALTFVAQGDTGQRGEDYVVPRLVLDGGVLQTNRSPRVWLTDIVTDLELTSDSVIQVSTRDSIRIQGSVTGSGGVRLEQLFDPQSEPGFDDTSIFIQGPTSYEGPTYVGNVRAVFTHPLAMGDATAGTLVDGGELQLVGGGGGESIRVERGTLSLTPADTPYTHHIELVEGSILYAIPRTGVDAPTASVTTPIRYQGGVQFGLSPVSNERLTLEGEVQGTGSVFLGEEVEIRGALRARGHVFAHDRGPNILSGELQQAGDVYVTNDGDLVELAGDLGAPEGRLYVLPNFFYPQLVVSHDNILQAVTLDPRLAERVSFFDNVAIRVADGTTLTVTEDLQYLGGVLRGRFAGQSILTKKGAASGSLQDIAGSDFERVDVEQGALVLLGDAGQSAPDIHLNSRFAVAANISTSTAYTGDVHLNNALSDARRLLNSDLSPVEAALSVGAETTLSGDIYLGDRGSSLAGISSSVAAATLAPESQIHGGDLQLRGDLHIRGGQHSYSGSTTITGRSVVLEDQGRFNSTSAIIGDGELVLNNSTRGVHEDRIPDATPVHLSGMRLTLIGGEGSQVTETLGAVHATHGLSELNVQGAITPGSQTTLAIETLNRTPGAAILFDAPEPTTTIRFANAPVLDDNLIGGWAIVRGHDFLRDLDFATYGPNGVVAYRDLHTYATDLPTATASDNVFVTGQDIVTLSGDTAINALKTRNTDVDLNGNTLTLQSGGLLLINFSDTIRGGRLTAGTEGGAELQVSGLGRIESDIVDNPHGSIGLTYTGGDELILSGTNTYSGPTVVNSGRLTLTTEAALPAGGDIVLSGGSLRLEFDSATPHVVGDVVLHNSGDIRSGSGFNPILQPASIQIESGSVTTSIVGDAPLVKTGPGRASFDRSLAEHHGPVDIQQGTLEINALGETALDDDHAITIHRGARLAGNTDVVFSGRKIRLDGGSLLNEVRGGIAAPIEVLAGGGALLVGRGANQITSAISGSGDLIVEGGFGNGRMHLNADLSAFVGDLFLTGGRTVIARSNSGYSGDVTITAAEVTVSQQQSLGAGKVTITSEGLLKVASPVTADIDLDGGVIGFAGSPGARLDGELRVGSDSRFFLPPPIDQFNPKPRITSTLFLGDGVNLSVLGFPTEAQTTISNLRQGRREQLQIDGRVIVEGSATISSFDALVELTGSIQPGVDDATLLLEGNNTFALQASLELVEKRSLSIRVDGQSTPLQLAGAGAGVTGDGTLVADVLLENGATIAPGDSPGTLTIDGSLTLGSGAIYEWEINDALGAAGSEEGWDLLQITAGLALDATVENPFVLKVLGLTEADLIGEIENWDPSQSQSWLIASTDSLPGFDPAAIRIDATNFTAHNPLASAGRLSLQAAAEGLTLRYDIPEPATAMLIALILLTGSLQRRGEP